jgi:hypothetical protein
MSGRIVRGAGEGSATVSAGGSRKARSSTTALPKFFPEIEPVETIELGHRVATTIYEDIAWTQENVGPVETGGWLLGRSRNYVLTRNRSRL